MRTAISFVVCVLLLAPMAVAQSGRDNLIVPGVRIGKWTLQMTIDDLVRMNGATSAELLSAGSEQNLSARRDSWLYGWASLALRAETFDKKKIEALYAGARGGVVPFKTDRGILLLQSTRSDIFKVYGKPTVVLKAASTGTFDLVYDKIGIAFLVWGGGEIREIEIFLPGNAKNLWKF